MNRPLPRHTIAHLSDLHLRPAADPLVGGVVDTAEQLRRAVGVLSSWDRPCDAWLFTGDLSDTGTADTYELARSIVEPAAARAGVQVIWANGNHDEPAELSRVLWGQQAEAPLNREYRIGGLRVLTLDSNVPREPHGLVSDASLDWLADRLSTAAPDGTVLALHHPPIPPVQDAAARWPLTNPRALAQVVAGSDVRLIVGGHFHQTSFSTLAGVPVAGAVSLASSQDLTAGLTLRDQDAHQGFSIIEVYPDTVVVTAAQLATGRGVHPALSPDER